MIVFKTVDMFDQTTGKKIGTQKVYDHSICDYTGEKITDYENPNEYIIDFNSNDPCFGDGEGERWLYDYEKELYGEEEYDNMDGYHYELFGQTRYIFKSDEDKWEGCEVFHQMLTEALKELKDGIYSLDHLLRWSRGQMLEKVIKSGKYVVKDFISE